MIQENYQCHRQEYDLPGQIQVKNRSNLTVTKYCFRRKGDISGISEIEMSE